MFKNSIGLAVILAASFAAANVAFADKGQDLSDKISELRKTIAQAQEAGDKSKVEELCKVAKSVDKERSELPENSKTYVSSTIVDCL